MPRKPTHPVTDYLIILAGTFCYAAAVVAFIRPNSIPMGGVTGIALLAGGLLSLPVGVLVLVMNIPLFLLSFRKLGRSFLIRTLAATVAASLLLDALEPLVTRWSLSYSENPLLAALYGGVLSGLGLGLVFSRGATTGGSDILSKLIHMKSDRWSIGRINLTVNALVILASSLIYQSIEAALYALVIQYVSSSVIDGILIGMDNSSAAFIITNNPQAVSDAILTSLNRGVTGLTGTGMYSKEARATLLCAVRGHEVTALKKLVIQADPDAFVILTNAREVLGRGFKSYGT